MRQQLVPCPFCFSYDGVIIVRIYLQSASAINLPAADMERIVEEGNTRKFNNPKEKTCFFGKVMGTSDIF